MNYDGKIMFSSGNVYWWCIGGMTWPPPPSSRVRWPYATPLRESPHRTERSGDVNVEVRALRWENDGIFIWFLYGFICFLYFVWFYMVFIWFDMVWYVFYMILYGFIFGLNMVLYGLYMVLNGFYMFFLF